MTKVTDGRGNSTTYQLRRPEPRNRRRPMPWATRPRSRYDADGNLTKVQAPTPAGQTARTTTYAYDSMNRLTTVTDPLGYQTVYGYDADGNQTSVKDPLGRITTTVYDALNRPTVVIDPMGNRATTTYDAEGEKLTVTDPLNRITTYTYSVRGWVATVTDPMGYVVTYTYTADRARTWRPTRSAAASSRPTAIPTTPTTELIAQQNGAGRYHDLHLRRRRQHDDRGGRQQQHRHYAYDSRID